MRIRSAAVEGGTGESLTARQSSRQSQDCRRLLTMTASSLLYRKSLLSSTSNTHRTIPVTKLYQISFFSTGKSGSYSLCILRISSPITASDIGHPFTIEGNWPPKNSHEISNPTHMM